MAYPDNLDTFAYPNSSQKMNDPAVLSTVIVADLNNAATALEEKVGIDWSADIDSLDFKTSRITTKGDLVTSNGTNLVRMPAWTNGYMLVADSTKSTGLDYINPTSWWTVTTVWFTNWSGFTGSITNPTTTPNISLWTSIAGLLKWLAWALVAAVAWTDYSVPAWVETLSNKTLTSPTLNSPTLNNPAIVVWSDANWDLWYRNAGAVARLAVGTTNDFLTVTGGTPVWTNPFMYEGTLTIPTATSNWGWVVGSTHYQMTAMWIGMVSLTRWTSGYAKVRYSPDNATWTDIVNISTAWSNTFPLFLKKWFYYYVEVDSPVWGSASTASITALF